MSSPATNTLTLTKKPIVQVSNLNKNFGGTRALNNISFELETETIYGLFGRNGAGKTTLLTALTGQTVPNPGSKISLFGHTKVSGGVLAGTHLMRTGQEYSDDTRVYHVLRMAAIAYHNWDSTFALELLNTFGVPLKAKARKLSDGQRSGLGITIALASRAPLTLMDEPYSGLDPVARATFYDLLLAEFTNHPRTFVISTHLIDEISAVLNHVLILADGELIANCPAEEANYLAQEITGNTDAVTAYLTQNHLGYRVRKDRTIGSLRAVQIAAEITEECDESALALGVNIAPVSLQDTVSILTQSTMLEPSQEETP